MYSINKPFKEIYIKNGMRSKPFGEFSSSPKKLSFLKFSTVYDFFIMHSSPKL